MNNNVQQEQNQNNNDIEMNVPFDVQDKVNLLGEKNVRLGFIKKVYSILTVQLLFTVLFSIISMTSTKFSTFQANNLWLIWVFYALTIVTMIMMACFQRIARRVPHNYVLLGVFTFCEAYIVSYITANASSPGIVVMAAAFTLGITFSLTLYAFTTKSDFTMLGGVLYMIAMSLFLFCIFMWAFGAWTKTVYIVYCAIGVILYGFYLIYDTQLIIGGKRYQLDIDDYVFAALMLYLDIIMIFLYILQILNSSRS